MQEDKHKEKTADESKFGFKDLIAVMIAQFQILMPIILGGLFLMFLVLLFMTKVWLRV